MNLVLWALVLVALFLAVLAVIRVLDGKPKTRRRVEHWPDCPTSCDEVSHVTIRHIPSPADAWMDHPSSK